MAVNHIDFRSDTPHGRKLREALDAIQDGYRGLGDVRAIILQMRDGDGSDASHYTYVADKFGFPDTATAKAGFEELDSFYAKLSTDGEVTFVNAAMLQLLAKFG
jgi:hypothetical protein